jgi:drug/metabolite transporter (DMT)-like permease
MNDSSFGAKPAVLRCSRCGTFVDWAEARAQVVCECRPRLELPPVLVREAADAERQAAVELFRRDFGPTGIVAFGEVMDLDATPTIVAEMNAEIAGALAYRLVDASLHIVALATDPMWQRSGVGGYLVAVAVHKDLEDLPGPIRATAGAAAFRSDVTGTLARISGNLLPIERKDWPLLMVSSTLGLILNQWLFVKGLSITTAINATLLSTSIPVSTLVIGMFLGTDRTTWRRMLGIALAAAGVLYLIGPGRSDFSAAKRVGDLLIVANSLCYGAYIAVSKDLVRKYNALTVITWIFIIGAVATIPPGLISLSQIQLSNVSWKVWIEVAYIIVLPTAITYYLNAWALARVPPSTVAVYIYLQPLIAFVVAPIVLGETLGARALISSLLIFVGVFIVTRSRRRPDLDEAKILKSI